MTAPILPLPPIHSSFLPNKRTPGSYRSPLPGKIFFHLSISKPPIRKARGKCHLLPGPTAELQGEVISPLLRGDTTGTLLLLGSPLAFMQLPCTLPLMPHAGVNRSAIQGLACHTQSTHSLLLSPLLQHKASPWFSREPDSEGCVLRKGSMTSEGMCAGLGHQKESEPLLAACPLSHSNIEPQLPKSKPGRDTLTSVAGNQPGESAHTADTNALPTLLQTPVTK